MGEEIQLSGDFGKTLREHLEKNFGPEDEKIDRSELNTLGSVESYPKAPTFGWNRENSPNLKVGIASNFNRMLSQRSIRISKLRGFLEVRGFDLDQAESGLGNLNALFFDNVYASDQAADMSEGWCEMCLDISVFLGEAFIRKHPEASWCILEETDKQDLYFREIGLKREDHVFDVFSNAFGFGRNLVGGFEQTRWHREELFQSFLQIGND